MRPGAENRYRVPPARGAQVPLDPGPTGLWRCPAIKLFLDTANLDEIREVHSWGVLAGVTTNPTLIARERVDFHQRIREICALVDGPVNAEVISTTAEEMVREAEALAALAPNVVIKLPMTVDGLKATSALARKGIPVNVTLVFSANQGLLAARAGARYVSPFLGRLDEIGHDGMEVVAQLVEIFEVHDIATEVIAASIRHPLHVLEAARAGAHIATMPYAVMRKLVDHPLRDLGLERFLADWRQAQEELGARVAQRR